MPDFGANLLFAILHLNLRQTDPTRARQGQSLSDPALTRRAQRELVQGIDNACHDHQHKEYQGKIPAHWLNLVEKLSIINLQNRQKSLLRNLNTPDLFHAFFTGLLFFK